MKITNFYPSKISLASPNGDNVKAEAFVGSGQEREKRRYGTTQGNSRSVIRKAMMSRSMSRLMMKQMTMVHFNNL